MLAFENYLREKFEFTTEGGLDSFFKFFNLIQWNTFDLMVNFLIVEKMTTYKTGDNYADFRKYIEEFISAYNEIKRDLRDLRKIIEKSLKLLIRFFDSSPTKIKYAKFIKFSDPVREAYENLKKETRKGTPEKFENLLRDYKLTNTCITIYNCVKSNCSFIEKILQRLNSFLTKFRGKQGGSIVENAKSIGVNIFNMFDFYDNKNFLVNIIRTPSIFLGNLLEDDEEFNKGLEDENKKMDKKYNQRKKRNDEIMNLLNMSKKDCIRRFIAVYFYENEIIGFDDYDFEGKKTIFNNDFSSWFKEAVVDGAGYPDGEFYKEMAGYGAQLLLDDADDLDDLEISKKAKDNLDYLVKSYQNYKEKNKLENNFIINENNEKINKLKKQNDELKQNKKNYLERGEAVTEEFMKEHNIEIIEEDENGDYNNFVKYARENGITDDIIKENIDTGDVDWKKIWEEKNDKLIKLLQDKTLEKWGKEAVENEDDEDMKDVEEEKEEEINTNIENKEVDSDEENKTYKAGKGSKKIDTKAISYKLKEKRKKERNKRKNQEESAKNVVGMEGKEKNKK